MSNKSNSSVTLGSEDTWSSEEDSAGSLKDFIVEDQKPEPSTLTGFWKKRKRNQIERYYSKQFQKILKFDKNMQQRIDKINVTMSRLNEEINDLQGDLHDFMNDIAEYAYDSDKEEFEMTNDEPVDDDVIDIYREVGVEIAKLSESKKYI